VVLKNKIARGIFIFIVAILSSESLKAGFLEGDIGDEQVENAPQRIVRNNKSTERNSRNTGKKVSSYNDEEYLETRNRYNRSSSSRNARRPATYFSLSQSKMKFGVVKSFYGNEGYSQMIGAFLGYSKEQSNAVGYSVFGNFNLFDKSISAARADLNLNYGLAPNLVAFGGLNINQFFGSNVGSLSPGLGFQAGAAVHLKSDWGIQGQFHKLVGSVSSNVNGVSQTYSFETSGFELSTYLNF
jgi:hypothetical protein